MANARAAPNPKGQNRCQSRPDMEQILQPAQNIGIALQIIPQRVSAAPPLLKI